MWVRWSCGSLAKTTAISMAPMRAFSMLDLTAMLLEHSSLSMSEYGMVTELAMMRASTKANSWVLS